jgi:hypothetical protein
MRTPLSEVVALTHMPMENPTRSCERHPYLKHINVNMTFLGGKLSYQCYAKKAGNVKIV